MQAIRFERTGDPSEVLTLGESPEPNPTAGQVLVEVEARNILPADASFVRGTYRVRPTLPQVAGLEGAGRVVAVGPGVSVAIGTRVAFRWPGAWAERIAVPVERTFPVPDDIPIEAAAQFTVNPLTAWGLLEASGTRPGDWIVLTAATSSLAAVVAALARARDQRVVGVVRAGAQDRLPPGMLSMQDDDPQLESRIRSAAEPHGVAALLDSVGGPLLNHLLGVLRPGATIVAYGVMSSEPAQVRNATMVYSNLTWKGFGIDRWWAGVEPAQRPQILESLWSAIRRGELPLPVRERLPLREFPRALTLAARGGNAGKVLLI
jgi:NADPH2:quinone reductase